LSLFFTERRTCNIVARPASGAMKNFVVQTFRPDITLKYRLFPEKAFQPRQDESDQGKRLRHHVRAKHPEKESRPQL
jgi:hypothetical protein